MEAAVVHHDNDTDLRHGVEHIQIHHRAVMKNSHISDFQKEKFLPGHVNQITKVEWQKVERQKCGNSFSKLLSYWWLCNSRDL